MKIVQLHDGRPPLTDVPNCLRLLADNIEAGINGEVTGIFVIIPRRADYPEIHGYGDVEGPNDPIIQLALAQHKFLANLIVRS